jgi:hypothetical protein
LLSIWKNLNQIDFFILIQGLFIVLLIGVRIKSKKITCFIPELFLFSLPYFWSLSLFTSVESWFSQWLFPLLTVFSLSLLIVCRSEMSKTTDRNTLQRTLLAAIFILLYAVLLRQTFPPFTDQLFKTTTLNSIAFFAGLPISFVALRSFNWPE